MGIVNVQVDPVTGAMANPNRLYAQIAQQLINTHGVGRDQVCESRAPPLPLPLAISYLILLLLGVRQFRPKGPAPQRVGRVGRRPQPETRL